MAVGTLLELCSFDKVHEFQVIFVGSVCNHELFAGHTLMSIDSALQTVGSFAKGTVKLRIGLVVAESVLAAGGWAPGQLLGVAVHEFV